MRVSKTPFDLPLYPVQAFPILAVVPGVRRVGLVALDARLRVRHVFARDLRRSSDEASRIELVRRDVGRIADSLGIGLVVGIALSPRARRWKGLSEELAATCSEHRAWYRELTVRGACLEIASHDDESLIAMELATQYRELADRLWLDGPRLYRNRDHERDTIPLVHAFFLAHAVAVQTLRASARSEVSKTVAA